MDGWWRGWEGPAHDKELLDEIDRQRGGAVACAAVPIRAVLRSTIDFFTAFGQKKKGEKRKVQHKLAYIAQTENVFLPAWHHPLKK